MDSHHLPVFLQTMLLIIPFITLRQQAETFFKAHKEMVLSHYLKVVLRVGVGSEEPFLLFPTTEQPLTD